MAISKLFVLAGKAVFTIDTPAKGHYTFKVRKKEANGHYPECFFVHMLVGPGNYVYLGMLDKEFGQMRLTAKSPAGVTLESFHVKLLNRVLDRVWHNEHAEYEKHGFRTMHEGTCGRCGRELTHPDSIDTGIGPECRKIMGLPELNPKPKKESKKPKRDYPVLSQEDEDRMIQEADRLDEERRCKYKMNRDRYLGQRHEGPGGGVETMGGYYTGD